MTAWNSDSLDLGSLLHGLGKLTILSSGEPVLTAVPRPEEKPSSPVNLLQMVGDREDAMLITFALLRICCLFLLSHLNFLNIVTSSR